MKIDEFAIRDLPPAEARKLAQQALDDPDLFDALVARGALEASLEAPAVQSALSRPQRRFPWTIALGVAAALLLALFLWRSSSHQIPQPVEQARAVVSKPAILPSLDPSAGRPVLIASSLLPAHSSDVTAFRGDAAASGNRQPQSSGRIVAIEDGEATVNLGSLDGLAKGTALGPIVITTVFRDHARGTIANGASIHGNDPVQVPPSVHIAAVLHEVDALASIGNLNSARDLARNALASGSSAATRPILEKLAALDYQAGALDAAREHYEAAADNFFDPPAASPSEQAATLNSLGALYLLRGDPASAVKPLNLAASITAINPDLRAQILNNLGVLSELTGDLATARDHYSRAAAEKPSTRRNIAQGNLSRIANLKQP